MLETLRAWLNGTRDYPTGVALYDVTGRDLSLKRLFLQGENMYNKWRLQEELLKICAELKAKKRQEKGKITASFPERPYPLPRSSRPDIINVPGGNQGRVVGISLKQALKDHSDQILQKERIYDNILETAHKITAAISIKNPDLYNSCKAKADRAYKEVKNKQAILFNMIPANEYENPNRQDLVTARSELACQIVAEYNNVSQLYDDADFVKLHGHLPYQEPVRDDEDPFKDLPDHLIAKTLDNTRKNVNKLKKRYQTPERIALIQKHDRDIEILKEKWRLLQQQT